MRQTSGRRITKVVLLASIRPGQSALFCTKSRLNGELRLGQARPFVCGQILLKNFFRSSTEKGTRHRREGSHRLWAGAYPYRNRR